MPRGDTHVKKHKKREKYVETKLVYATEDQVYGKIMKAVGGSFFIVKCADGKERRCKMRSKRPHITENDYVIVSLREYDTSLGDIVHKYKYEHSNQIEETLFSGLREDDDADCFEDI